MSKGGGTGNDFPLKEREGFSTSPDFLAGMCITYCKMYVLSLWLHLGCRSQRADCCGQVSEPLSVPSLSFGIRIDRLGLISPEVKIVVLCRYGDSVPVQSIRDMITL